MNIQQITSDDQLIADFIGYKINQQGYMVFEHVSGQYYADRLQFKTSFDWLMPVIKKVLTICSENELDEWEIAFYNDMPSCEIAIVYKTVVDFIKWYNKEIKK